MKNTLDVISDLPALSDRETELLGYMGQCECSLHALNIHFNLSPREFVAFVTSAAVQAALRAMSETVRLTLEVAAMRTRESAMAHLQGVCDRSCIKPEGDKETRLAATTLGKLVQQALTRPKPPAAQRVPKDKPAKDTPPPQPTSLDDLISGADQSLPPDHLEMLRLASGPQALSSVAGNATTLSPPAA